MSIDLSCEPRLDTTPTSTPRLFEALGWVALGALLTVALPLFVRMPVTSDVAFYDTCAQHVLRGGALERDLFFLLPPGMVWSRILVRSLLGWSSEAVRLADLAVVSAIIWLLARWLRAAGLPRAARVWAAVLLFAFYLSTSEWSHAQPDIWMLLPALAALHLRLKQVQALTGQPLPRRRTAALSLLEGMCWATACLFKPFVAVPALLVWLASVGLVRRAGKRWSWWLVRDTCCLLAGGLLVGAAWQGWLLASGSWSAYWRTMQDFRSDYYSYPQSFFIRCLAVFVKPPPWGALQLVALPVALAALARLLPGPRRAQAPGDLTAPLLGACYVGWLFQANFLQFQFYYHLVPAVLLALTLLADCLSRGDNPRRSWAILLALVACAVARQETFSPARLSLWGRCWSEGYSPELHDRLALDSEGAGCNSDWRELEKVAEFLRAKHVGDGQLTCYHATTIHLYVQLGVTPATRFLLPDGYVLLFPQKTEQIQQELRNSTQRYIVTDMTSAGLRPAQAEAERPGQPNAFPPDFSPGEANRYPFSEPVVFRAGRYYVHEVRGRRAFVAAGRQTSGD